MTAPTTTYQDNLSILSFAYQLMVIPWILILLIWGITSLSQIITAHLHVAGWNLLPRRKHLLWDSVHSHAHLVRLSGCVLGHTLLQLHWHVSLLKVWWGLQDFGWVLHTHWHVFLSRWRFGPQPAVLKSFRHTHRHVSSSSSLLGPQKSCSNGSLRGKKENKSNISLQL